MLFPIDLWFHILSFLKHGKVKEDNIIYTYFLGIKEGKSTYIYENIKVIKSWKNDKLHGRSIHYINNIKYTNMYYVDGILNGKYSSYYENGNIKYIANMKDGKLYGKAINYGKNREIVSVTHFKNNKQHGRHIIYGKNKKIVSVINFDNGEEHGKHTSYFDNGNIRISKPMKNGKMHGECFNYYNNGNLHTLLKFDNGKLYGNIIHYYPNQTVHKKIHIIKDYHATITIYDENGQLMQRRTVMDYRDYIRI